MFVYVFCFSLIWILSFHKKNPRNHKIYCVGITVLLCLLMGFRSESLGMNDVQYIYMPMFQRISNMRFSDVLEIYPFYRGNLLAVLTKLFTYVCKDKYLWLICVSIPSVIAIGKLVYNESEYPAMSFFMLFGTHIYLVNMYLIRHSLAMAFLIFAFSYIKKEKFVRFAIMVLVAAMFHSTAIVFIIAYFVAKFRFDWKTFVLTIVGAFLVIRWNSSVFKLVFKYINNEYYSKYSSALGSKQLTYFYVFLLILLLVICCRWFSDNKQVDSVYFNISCLAVIFMSLTAVVADFYRMGMFFGVFNIILLPNSIKKIKDMKIRMIVSAALIVFFGYFAISGIQDAGLSPYRTWLFS